MTMDSNSEPDIIRYCRPVIDERPDGIYMYFHPLPAVLLNNPIIIGDDDFLPDDQSPHPRGPNGRNGNV